MKTTVRHGVNWFLEAVALLEISYSDENYQATYARWQNRHGERARRWQAITSELMKMEQAVRSALSARQEQARFYFQPLHGDTTNASFLLGWRFYFGFESMDEARRQLLAQTDRERTETFLKALQGIEYDNGEISVERLFRNLVNSDLSGDQKQSIGQMFFHYAEYLDPLLELIGMAIGAMQPWRAFLEKEAEACAAQWDAFLEKGDILAWLNERFQLVLDDNPQGCVIQPNVTGCNAISLHADQESDGSFTCYTMRVSVLVTESDEQPAEADPAAVCDVLKVLADRSKMDILRILKDQRAYGGELARRLELTTATISYHMQSLLNYNLVGLEKVNNRIYYQLNRRRLEELLEDMRALLLE